MICKSIYIRVNIKYLKSQVRYGKISNNSSTVLSNDIGLFNFIQCSKINGLELKFAIREL